MSADQIRGEYVNPHICIANKNINLYPFMIEAGNK